MVTDNLLLHSQSTLELRLPFQQESCNDLAMTSLRSEDEEEEEEEREEKKDEEEEGEEREEKKDEEEEGETKGQRGEREGNAEMLSDPPLPRHFPPPPPPPPGLPSEPQ